MKRNICLITVLVGIIMLSISANSAIAGITNSVFADDDFDGTIDGWTHNGFVSPWNPGSAMFFPDIDEATLDARLSQVFTLDSGSTLLSFDGTIGDFSETAIFTAALLDPITHISLVPTVDGLNFFSISSEEVLPPAHLLDFTGSVDVSTLSGQVELVFNLNNDYLDELNPSVVLSNLTIVPEPTTICMLALGGLGLFRKRVA